MSGTGLPNDPQARSFEKLSKNAQSFWEEKSAVTFFGPLDYRMPNSLQEVRKPSVELQHANSELDRLRAENERLHEALADNDEKARQLVASSAPHVVSSDFDLANPALHHHK